MFKRFLSFFIGIVFGVLLANGAGSDPNGIMKAIYHETTKFEDHTKNERTAINRGDTGSAIFDLKNFGNENTNNMSGEDWVTINSGSNTIQDGNQSLISNVQNYQNGNGDGAADRMDAVVLRAASNHDDVKDTWIGKILGAFATKEEIENPPSATEISLNAYNYIEETDPNAPTSDKILFAVGAGVFNEQNVYQREYDAIETSLNNPITGSDGNTYYMLNGVHYAKSDIKSLQTTAKNNLENAKIMNGVQAGMIVGSLLINSAGGMSGINPQSGKLRVPRIGGKTSTGGAGKLNVEQAGNLKRFTGKWSNSSSSTNPIKVESTGGGGVKFTKEVPGKVPGSKAVYQKEVNAAGKTISTIKTTYDPQGNVVHVKPK